MSSFALFPPLGTCRPSIATHIPKPTNIAGSLFFSPVASSVFKESSTTGSSRAGARIPASRARPGRGPCCWRGTAVRRRRTTTTRSASRRPIRRTTDVCGGGRSHGRPRPRLRPPASRHWPCLAVSASIPRTPSFVVFFSCGGRRIDMRCGERWCIRPGICGIL